MNSFINNPHFRIFLFPLALFYWGVIFWRNIFYNLGIFVSYSLPCKVISVGNITVGGTGKTPAVIYLAKLLKNNGYRVGVLSRGYGRITKGTIDLKENKNKDWKHFGEEPLLISKKLIDVPVVVDNNRFRGGRYLFKKYKPQIIILDDGFQHRSLHRNLDIVLINANQSIHDYKMLPYGLLREPLQHLKRSDIVIMTKMNIKNPPEHINKKLKSLKINHYHSRTEPSSNLIDINGKMTPLISMKHQKALAISGIGDPLSFELILGKQNIEFVDHIALNDHHEYNMKDFISIEKKIKELKPDFLITTEKDLLKLKNSNKIIIEMLYALPIQLSLSKKCVDKILNKLKFN